MKTVRSIFIIMVITIGFLTISVNTFAETTWEKAKSSGKITIVMATGYPPFSYYSEGGKQSGFDTDLVRAFADSHGLNLDIKIVQFEGVIPSLIGNKSDMIVSIWATEDRAKVVDFSDVYWKSGMTFAARADKPLIESMEAAKGKTIGVQQGSWAQSVLKEQSPDATQKSYKGGPVEMYQDLDIGRTDAVFEDRDVSKFYLHKTDGKFHYSNKIYAPGNYAWAIRKEDSDFLAVANEFLKQAKADGSLESIASKYGLGGVE